jgi:VWFA-related protein
MTGTISGQQKPKDEQMAGNSDFNVNVNANLVTTDVTVVGKRTGDFRSEDFVLFDNGISQKITYFSRNELPLAVAIILDTSNSAALWMPMQRLAALMALSRLKPGDQAALFTFAGDHRPNCKLTEDKLLVAKEIGNIRSGGRNSNLRDALFVAANYLKENAPRRHRTIILISDDIDTNSRYSPKKCLAALLDADVTLYGIALPNDYWGIDNKLQAQLDEMRNGLEAMQNRYKEELSLIAKKTGGDNFSTVPLGKARSVSEN